VCYVFHMGPLSGMYGGECFRVFRLGGGSWGKGNPYEVEGKLSASVIKITSLI
jgi:hypothetical protein